MKEQERGKHMKHQKKAWLALGLVAALAVGAGIYTYTQYGTGTGEEGVYDSGTAPGGSGGISGTPVKTEFTEEEKEIMESQTGVTVTEDGVMEVNIGEILAEESSVKITRDQAGDIAMESLGEGSEIGACDIREHEGVKYWVVQVDKGKETYQIWLNADTGEEFINQKVG